jgi:hypothetical protein
VSGCWRKRGLEMTVRGLEELREMVVRLETEVEAGRREREAWQVPGFSFVHSLVY